MAVISPIFISYASIDQDVAETICDALQARGHSCWIACRNIGPGENFQESIVRAIRTARVMLLVFTSNANNSDEIKKEVVLAGRHRVTVLPVRVEDVAPNDAFAYEFATRQWIDLFKDWEREIDRLVTQIDAIVAVPKAGDSESAAAKPAARPTPTPLQAAQKTSQSTSQSSSYVPLVAAAVVLVAALCAGGLYFHTRTAATPPPTPPAVPQLAAAAAPVVSPPTAPAPAPVTPAPAVVATPPAPQPAPLPQPAIPASTSAFDGAWAITFSCPAAGSALGYSYRVAAQITDGMLHGEKGEKGKPGWLTIDGKIGADGTLNNLYVDSLVGASQVAIGNVARGTEFGYHVAGRLSSSSGTARRVEGRSCTLDFAKQ